MKVEIGCGNNKRLKEAICVDILDLPDVDIVFDVNLGLPFFENDSVDEIYSHHVLEHLKDLSSFMNEVYRVLKPGGIFKGEVPHFSNPYFYSDPTHKTTFGLYTLNYFVKNQDTFRRKVPNFYNDLNFEIVKYELIFKNVLIKNTLSNWILKFLFSLFNRNSFYQELYEGFFVKFFSCYEIKFELKKSQ